MNSAKWQDASWRTSSHSQPAGTDCVEVAHVVDTSAVRDSKDPTGPVLTFTAGALSTLVRAIKTGACDLP